MKRVVVILAAITLTLSACGDTPTAPTEFDRYRAACHEQDGALSMIDQGFDFIIFECIGLNGKKPNLPRFRK